MPTYTEMYVRVVCSYRENRGDTQFRGQDFIKYGERIQMKQTCIKCGHEKDISRYTKGWKTCKCCAWLKKHNFLYPDDWDKDIAEGMLKKIFDGEIECLNDLEDYTHKSVDEIINFITNDLNIGNIGTIKLAVRKKCKICGKEFETKMSTYHEAKFCSRPCYNQYRSLYCVGEKASVYTQTEQECTYCHKKIMLPKNALETVNHEGKNHHFCSRKCYHAFRSVYYRGDKSPRTGQRVSQDMRDRMRQNTVLAYEKGLINRQTKPQRLVNQMLDELNISYINEKSFKYYAIDNYLSDTGLLIEVMGDYFHANPCKYEEQNLNQMQHKNVIRDKRKKTYIKKYYGVNVLYLWESDINNDYNKCKQLIQYYVDNQGKISNYQSFNYNDDLSLVQNITNPYFIKNP